MLDEPVFLFGEEMTARDLVSLIGWALTHKLSRMARAVRYRFKVDHEEIVNEAVILILKQSQNPKWLTNKTSTVATLIVSCTYYTLLLFSNRQRFTVLGGPVFDDGRSFLELLATPKSHREKDSEDLFLQVSGILPPKLAKLILMRYGDPCETQTFEVVGTRMGVSKQRVQQLEKDAMAILRGYRMAIIASQQA